MFLSVSRKEETERVKLRGYKAKKGGEKNTRFRIITSRLFGNGLYQVEEIHFYPYFTKKFY